MNERIAIVGVLTLLTAGFVTFGQGCQGAKGTSTGNPLVDVRFDAYDPSAKVSRVAVLSVDSVTMCFKRLRLKASSSSTGDDLDLQLGKVTLSPAGTNLQSIAIPNGTYEQIEFDLDDVCGIGHSVELTNSHGSFATNDHTTIKFEGNITITDDTQTLDLAIQSIISVLGTVTNSNNIRNAAESVSGSF